jgi:hypothetical protein
VAWPSGRIDRFQDLDADTGYLLREGAGVPQPLLGFPAHGSANNQAKTEKKPSP